MAEYQDVYTGSHALIIGINDYQDGRWPPLDNAETDALELADVLASPLYQFSVVTLIGSKATRARILEVLERLQAVTPDARTLIYFAGRGYTRTDRFGRDTGYLVCYDTPNGSDSNALKLSDVTAHRDYSQAKHIAFIFDACYSGDALDLTPISAVDPAYFKLRASFQALSAGLPNEAVSNIQSMTRHLLPLLRKPRRLLTLAGLGLEMKHTMMAVSDNKQMPIYGHLTGSQGADFIFYEQAQPATTDRLLDDLRADLTDDNPRLRLRAISDAEELLADPQFGEDVRQLLEAMSSDDPDADVRRRAKTALPPTPSLSAAAPDSTQIHHAEFPRPARAPDQASQRQGSPEPEEVAPDPILDLLPPPFKWRPIPAGRVTLDDNAGTFDVQPFKLAMYPVTYAQFQIFLDAKDGFKNPVWRNGLAAKADHWKTPSEQKWKIDNHPRDNVSWYDAIAFCRWLTSKVGYTVRLPTECEWQWAAQGPEGREYPWGNEFDPARCNSVQSGLKKTTPVDAYSQGASPFGVMDMAGNVWEWCLNTYNSPEHVFVLGDEKRALRGGAWHYAGTFNLRVANRDWNSPNYGGNFIGLRLARSG